MPRRKANVPKHRSALPEPTRRRGLRRSLLLSGAAVAASGLVVSAGIAMLSDGAGSAASAALASSALGSHGSVQNADTGSPASPSPASAVAKRAAFDLGDRTQSVSRSTQRKAADPVKIAALDRSGG